MSQHSFQTMLLGCTALFLVEGTAHAQTGQPDQPSQGVEDIIVTAQKREQVLQDVPIAITALTSEALQANRVVSVTDLNGLAPGMTVRPSAGGVGVPSFTMRGITSYGVVPGSDKQVSIYIDGVYLGASRGSMFDLPDIARIEVLRGPQGTLFGRNATAGAVSIVTRDPTGNAGFKQQLTFGNYGQFRTRTTVDLPAWGDFSAYVSFVHEKRDGDIANTGVGTSWTRNSPSSYYGTSTSPERLGDKDVNNVFAAIKFEPAGDFKAVYKFDYATNHFSAEGTGLSGYDATAPLLGPLVDALIKSQPTPVNFASDSKRPQAVNNDFSVPNYQRTMGHSLTMDFSLTDNITVKNIASYRKTYMFSSSQIEGTGGLIFTGAALVPYATFATFANPANAALVGRVQAGDAAALAQISAIIGGTAAALGTPGSPAFALGSRFCLVCNSNEQRSEQYSDELQVNFENDTISATVGAMYFHQKDQAGGVPGMANNFSFMPIPGSGVLPLGNWSTTYSKGTSIAAYAQAEVRLSDQFELIGGARITHDEKDATLVTGGTNGTMTGAISTVSPTYKKTKPNYAVGVNYKPREGILLYGKYATAFVSGGIVADIAFEPETVTSFEVGLKADFLDHHLRTNLAVFAANYKHQQQSASGSNYGRPELSTIIVDAGDRTARGFELEVTAVPVHGFTLNGGLSYTDVKLENIPAPVVAAVGGTYSLAGLPEWTGNISGQYQTEAIVGDAYGQFRVDATWHSDRNNSDNIARVPTLVGGSYADWATTEASWVVNSRLSLRDINIGGAKAEIAGWVRNLFDNREALFPLRLQNIYNTTYLPARTYGVDVSIAF